MRFSLHSSEEASIRIVTRNNAMYCETISRSTIIQRNNWNVL